MKTSLKEIFDTNYSNLCNYAYAQINDKHQAKDLVQTVFIQLWENDKILQLEDPAPYLLRCVRYKCLDYLKDPKRKRELFPDKLPDIRIQEEQTLQEEDIIPMLQYFVSSLPPKMQEVFIMSRQQGMTYNDIAEELDIKPKTVENQMSNALKKLRVNLKKHQYLPALLIFFK